MTLALLRHAGSRELRLWYAEGVYIQEGVDVGHTWEPLRNLSARAGRWYVWFWRRVLSPPDLETLLDGIRSEGVLRTDCNEILLDLRERPPVFLSRHVDRPPLCPHADESAWIWEFWDDQKRVLNLGDEAWQRSVNTAVKRGLGVDLNEWVDRIGNVVVFVPTGVKVHWDYDHVTRSAVIQTNLDPDELIDYDIELLVWDGEEISYQNRLRLDRPAAVFRDLTHFRRVQVTIWNRGKLIHQEGPLSILKRIMIPMSMAEGTRAGTTYTRTAGLSDVGEKTEPPWVRLQRDRRVATRKQGLAERLEFKFYEPLATHWVTTRNEAVTDVQNVLSHAQRSVRIWDPYFGANVAGEEVDEEDDLRFIEKLADLSIDVQVLTSCGDWAGRGSETLNRLAARISQLRKAFPERFGRMRCKAWVLRKTTAFHDRFIIVDDQRVWLLGSSLRGLGRKHSTLVKLEHSEEVISAFDRIWKGAVGGWGQVVDVA